MRQSLSLVGLLLVLLAFQVISSYVPAKFLGFSRLYWSDTPGFVPGSSSSEKLPEDARLLPSVAGALVWEQSTDSNFPHRARTEGFHFRGEQFEVEIAGNFPKGVVSSPRIRLFNLEEDGEPAQDSGYLLPRSETPLSPKAWSAYRFQIPENLQGKEVRFELSANPGSKQNVWIAIRSRVNLYAAPTVAERLREDGLFWYAASFLSLVFGLLCVQLIPRAAALCSRPGLLFFWLLVFGALVHFRPETFFYYDEFHVLERFMERGLPGVAFSHNEHYLVAFFFTYYLEAITLLAEPYYFLIISFLLHATNGYLLFGFLKRLTGDRRYGKEAAALLAFFYVGNTLYAEVLRWTFEQSVLFFQVCMLIALCSAWDYLIRGGRWRLFVTVAASFLAPLYFGNGFSVIFWLMGVVAYHLVSSRRTLRLKSPLVLRSAAVLAFVLVALGTTAALYAANKEAVGNTVDKARPLERPDRVAGYAFAGAQLGTVLRGLGLFPVIEITGPVHLVKEIDLDKTIREPEIALAVVGLALSIWLLYLSMSFTLDRGWAVSCWALGQWILCSSFFLPAIGRWQLGFAQALVSRYHYTSFIGLTIVLLPLVMKLYQFLLLSPRPRLMFGVLSVYLTLLFGQQLLAGQFYWYFPEKNYRHISYIQKLQNWNNCLKQASPTVRVPFEGQGTPLENQNPLPVDSITLLRHPDQVYAVLHWMNPGRYPDR